VIARRLAENPDAHVLLLEAGGSDDVPSVWTADLWLTNLGSERDWGFQAEPNPALGGRALPLSMGKGLGGGSSINGMVWARGHHSDWDYFAAESGDAAWKYDNGLSIYRREQQGPGVIVDGRADVFEPSEGRSPGRPSQPDCGGASTPQRRDR
jgi:choline dehydrogenase